MVPAIDPRQTMAVRPFPSVGTIPPDSLPNFFSKSVITDWVFSNALWCPICWAYLNSM